jgi:ribosomal protein RSM22 (predicted rRNA methylase)
VIEEEIEQLCQNIPLAQLQKYFRHYSEQYRERKNSKKSLLGKMGAICYLLTRFPATLAVATHVLKEAKYCLGDFHSLLDLGAGPGTALLAARQAGLAIDKATLIEENSEFVEQGNSWCPSYALWECKDFLKQETLPEHEISIFCYSFGEVPEEKRKKILKMAWEASHKALILIEPGTPAAFKNILDARDWLIKWGGHVLAPCPHNRSCPLLEKKDWCHFSVRLQRSSLHRKIKGGELGYEDEKFCYMILSKSGRENLAPRILKTPKKQSGYVELQLCTQEGILGKKISSKNKENFRRAKKLNWGEVCYLDDC